MKRIFCFVAIALFAIGLVAPAFADSPWLLDDTKTVIVNDGYTTQVTAISIARIRPGKDRAMKVTVTSKGGRLGSTSTECVAAIYDCTSGTSVASMNTVLEGEVETDGTSTGVMEWIRGLRIFNGVTILQGANTVVTIEWQRDTP